jgi:hypothetical protein
MFVIRTSEWSKNLLVSLFSVSPQNSTRNAFQDQQALSFVLSSLSKHDFDQHVFVLPQKVLNSYPKTTLGVNSDAIYSPGDFAVHFAGCNDMVLCCCFLF